MGLWARIGGEEMSKKIGNLIIIAPEEDQVCEMCGSVEETRPYGPMGERICYDCGMKDEAMTKKRMGQVMFGDALDS